MPDSPSSSGHTIEKIQPASLWVRTRSGLVKYRATTAMATLWVLVYAAMLLSQGSFPLDANPMRFGAIGVETAHQFGDLTARSFASGQAWRAVTASFIHFSLLHLVVNTIGLVQFGRLLEGWYGSAWFLAVYLAIAAMGNSLAVGARIALGGGQDIHAAGGSSVLFGFLGLIAVAGWRLKTRAGDYMRRQMLKNLLIYGVGVGILARDVLDNFGHAGGAMAGALVGFADPAMLRLAGGPIARAAGLVATLVMASCIALQARTALAAAEDSRKQRVLQELFVAGLNFEVYEKLGWERRPFLTDPSLPARLGLVEALRRLDQDLLGKAAPGDPQAYRRWREIAGAGASRWPSAAESREFRLLFRPIAEQAAKAAGKVARAKKP